MESDFNTVFFVSRNKDNKHLKGFKERSKSFLTDKPTAELIEEFHAFVQKGVMNECSRFYVSVNPRNIPLANRKLIHFLIDNPETPPHKVNNKLVSLASTMDSALTKRWLFDYDGKESQITDFVKDVENEMKDGLEIELYKTKSGFAVIVERGFDTRELLKNWPDVGLNRDGSLLVTYKYKFEEF